MKKIIFSLILAMVSLSVFSQVTEKWVKTDSLMSRADNPLYILSNVEFDSSITYNDTYWKDATVSALATAPGVNAPTLRTVIGGIAGYGFNYQTANDLIYGQVQLNHDYKLGTDIEAHIHWSIEDAPAGGNDTVVIQFEYSWADIGEAFPTSDTITYELVVNASTQGVQYLTELDDVIEGAGGDGLSSILVFRFARLQNNPSDTYPSWFVLHDIDFHYQVDSPGSRGEISK